jgi:gliding motility-associated-like protein
MSKLITGLVTGGLLLLSLTMSAQPVVTITPQNIEVDVDQEFSVDLIVSNFSNVASLQFPIVWDPNVLEFVSVTNINETALPGLNINFFGYNPSQPGKLAFLWFESNFSGITLDDGTRIFSVNFRAKQDGTTEVAITDDPPGIEVTDPSEEELGLTPQNGTVVVGDGVGGNPIPLTLSLSNHNIEVGDPVCLQLTVGDFTDLLDLQFSISYNAALLQFTEARSFNASVPGLDAGAVSNPSAGVLQFQWTDPGSSGVSLPGGSVLLELCFMATGEGTAGVQFADTPVNIEAVQSTGDGGQQTIDVQTGNGTVNISSGTSVEGFQLRVGDASVQPGESFCLPVRVNDFQDIVGMQFSIQYDASLLQFDEAINFNVSVAGLDGNALVNPEAGVIRFSWIDGGFSGIDLPDGAVLFELCFQALSSGTANVSISDAPLPIEITQKVGADDQQVIDHLTEPGTVIIASNGGGGGGGGGGPGFLGFGLYMEDQVVQSGDQVCMPIKVQDFQEILGMQFSIDYDPSALEFVEATGFALNGLTASSINNSSPGSISVQWDDPAVLGQGLADGAVLMELCFKVTASNGVSTVVSFSNSPTPVEFTRIADNSIGQEVIEDYNFRNGRLIIGDGSGTFDGFGFILSDVNPQSGEEFCLELSVQDFTDIVGAQFTIEYDPTALEFLEVSNLNLEGLGPDAFGTPAPGKITFRWFDPSVAGVTLADGTVIFDLCFRASAPDGTITLVTFSNSPTAIEGARKVGDTEETIDEVNFNFGLVEIGCNIVAGGGELGMTVAYIAPGEPGSIDLEISGGNPPFTYQWTGPNGFTSQQQDISGLLNTGDYCVAISDVTGCRTLRCETVYEVLRFANVNIQNACSGESYGSISVDMAGGRSPYTFNWSTGVSGTPSLNSVSPGNYGLTVTDAKGDVISGTFEIKALPGFSIDVAVTPVTGAETNNNGAIDLFITGGKPGYSINWDNGATGTQIGNLSTGQYCATVTDANNCTVEICYDVLFQPVPMSFTTETTPTTCNGRSDGALTINIMGGNLPYEIIFGDGTQMMVTDGSLTLSNLPGGVMTFTIRDDTYATLRGEVTIREPAPIRIAEAVVVHDTEAPGCTGSIRLSITGGTPGYAIQWNAPYTGSQIVNLCEGPFIPTITDQKGCSRTFDPIEVTTFGASAEITNSKCPNDATGALTLHVSGGAGPFSFRWADDSGEIISGKRNLENVSPGNYTVTISEGSGNDIIREFTVGSTSNLSVSAEVLTDFNGFGVSCADASDAILLAEASNGIGSHFYEWTRGEEMLGAEAMLSNVPAGAYQVTAIDQSGCEITSEINVQAPPEIAVTATVTEISCYGEVDGEISVRASGGAGSTFFDFEWSNGSSNPEIRRLRPGSYTVTVSDALDCQTVKSYEVLEPDPIIVTIETKPANEGCNGSARAVVTGGTAPYYYKWNAPQTDSVLTDICPGNYEVFVTDSRGCEPEDPKVSGLVSDRRFPCMEAIPVITPNGDGDNDLFLINCIEDFPDNQLEVYNRYGQLVFQVQNYDNTWNGYGANGQALPEGPYYYVFLYVDGNGNEEQLKGSLTILHER